MKSLMKILIIAVGMLVVAGGIAYAADVTVESSNAITGTTRLELSITSSNLSVSAPTTKGPSTTTFNNSPIVATILDNTNGMTSLKAKISSSLPDQYGTSKTYYIKLGVPVFSPAADSEITAGEVSATNGDRSLTTSDQSVLDSLGGSYGTILSGSVSQSASLIINTDKRAYGDTSDSITIQYTLSD